MSDRHRRYLYNGLGTSSSALGSTGSSAGTGRYQKSLTTADRLYNANRVRSQLSPVTSSYSAYKRPAYVSRLEDDVSIGKS